MLRALCTLALLLLVAVPARADCDELDRRPWKAAEKYGLSIEAHAVGPACATSAIVLLVTNKKGEVVWSFIREAKTMMWFAEGVDSGPAMKVGLKNWLDSGFGGSQTSTSELPDWKEGAEAPEREGDGEFGFYASEGALREAYLEWKQGNHPLFCFVSGMESTTCIFAQGDTHVTDIGGFTFPG